MKKFLAVLMLAAPAVLSAQGAQPNYVTLDEAIRLGILHSTTMRGANNTLRQRQLTLTQRYAGFLPSVSTSAQIRPAQNGNDANFGASLSIGLNRIFDYNSYFDIGQAKRQLSVAEAQLVQSRYQITAQVKQRYFAALQAQEQLVTARNNLVVSDSNFRRIRERVRHGAVTGRDSLNQLSNLQNARLSVATAENNVKQAYIQLSRTMGIEDIVQPDPRDTLSFEIIPLDSAQLTAWLMDSPAMRTELAGIEDAKFSLRTAKLQYLPRPSGNLSFSRSGQGQGFFGFDDGQYRYSGGDFNLSFSVSLQVFNGFSREAQLVNARRSLEFAEQDYETLRRTQIQDLANALTSIRLLEESMKIQELQIVISEEALRMATVQYGLDMVTDLDLMNAQNSLYNSRNNLINSRYNYRNQIAQLEQMLGRDIR